MAATKETTNTIYIGGFSPSTTASSLHAAFLPFGEILDLQLPPDPTHQSKHRGFAFVSYSTPDAALDAIDNMHRNCLPGPAERGRVLKVNRAKPQKGVQLGGSNKPIWADEAWLKEHGVAPVGGGEQGAPIEPAGGADATES